MAARGAAVSYLSWVTNLLIYINTNEEHVIFFGFDAKKMCPPVIKYVKKKI